MSFSLKLTEEFKPFAHGTDAECVAEGENDEKLCIVPRQVYVERIVRPVYVCPNCEGTETEGSTVKIAPMPPQLIPHGIGTPELVAATIIDKFWRLRDLSWLNVRKAGVLGEHIEA